jgi:hypothetical protein
MSTSPLTSENDTVLTKPENWLLKGLMSLRNFATSQGVEGRKMAAGKMEVCCATRYVELCFEYSGVPERRIYEAGKELWSVSRTDMLLECTIGSDNWDETMLQKFAV